MRERAALQREVEALDLVWSPEVEREVRRGGAPLPTRSPTWQSRLMGLFDRKRIANEALTLTQIGALFTESRGNQLFAQMRADATARKFVKESGIWGLVALEDTADSGGLHVDAARSALRPRDEKEALQRSAVEALIGVPEGLPDRWEGAWFIDLHVARMRSLGLKGDPPPGLGAASVDTTTSTVTGLSLRVLFAADTSRDMSAHKSEVMLALHELSRRLSKVANPSVRKRLQACLAGFTNAAPLRILIAGIRLDGFALDPVTALVYVSDADVGNPARRKPVIRLPEAFITAAGQSGLPTPLLHELIHVHLMRHSIGSSAAWERARTGLALAGPRRLQRLASWLVYFHLSAQEEIFTFEHVALAFPPAPKIVADYRTFLTKSSKVLAYLGATFTKDQTTIPGVKTWIIEREVPSNLSSLRYVDGPRFREALALFPAAKT
jgi:hypothetical protein